MHKRTTGLLSLYDEERWVNWREEDGLKKPKNPRTKGNASTKESSTWATYHEAKKRSDNVGFVLGRVANYYVCGLDLDGCLDDNDEPHPAAREVIDRFNTYTEVSVSGRGVHLIFKMSVADAIGTGIPNRKTFSPGGRHKEMAFDRTRFYTVTHNVYESRDEICWLPLETVQWFIKDAGPRYEGSGGKESSSSDEIDRSAAAFAWFCEGIRDGKGPQEMFKEILAINGPLGEWARTKGATNNNRELNRVWANALKEVKSSPPGGGDRTLEFVRGDQVVMEPYEWLWPQRFARKKVGVIAGDPDQGKSQIVLSIAATVTRGGKWPDGRGRAPQGSVIILTAEDDIADTAAPRFVAAGGDLKYAFFLKMAREKNGRPSMFTLKDDLDLLERKVEEIGNVVMIGIDPVTAYLGVGKVDGRSTSDIRGVLAPLKDMIERKRIACLLISHFNKNVKLEDALKRITDSMAYSAVPRHVYETFHDPHSPDDPDAMLFVRAKNNLVKKGTQMGGLRYTIIEKHVAVGIDVPCIKWGEEVAITANEVIKEGLDPGGTEKLDTAVEFMMEFLAKGPQLREDVRIACELRNISERTMDRAATKLKIVGTKPFGGKMTWALPK
jgi:putative DNA primase/helicase